jgi:hypothetical protein
MVDSPTKNVRLLALSFALITLAVAIFFAMQLANAVFHRKELLLEQEKVAIAAAAVTRKGERLHVDAYHPVGSWDVAEDRIGLFLGLLKLAESDPDALALDRKYFLEGLTSN